MKHFICLVIIGAFLHTNSYSQSLYNTKPTRTTSRPLSSSYVNPSATYNSGYIKSNGTYVGPHVKTRSNDTNWDNYSTKGNQNPYTSENGSRAKDYSLDAYNYGSGKVIQTGERGGQFYINDKGNKVYTPKR